MVPQSNQVHHSFWKLELVSRKTKTFWSKECFTVQKGERQQGNLADGGHTKLFSEILGQITKPASRNKTGEDRQAGQKVAWAGRRPSF